MKDFPAFGLPLTIARPSGSNVGMTKLGGGKTLLRSSSAVMIVRARRRLAIAGHGSTPPQCGQCFFVPFGSVALSRSPSARRSRFSARRSSMSNSSSAKA